MFKFSSVLYFAFYLAVATARPNMAEAFERRAISQDLLTELTRFLNFSSGAYQTTCPSPLGTTLVKAFSSAVTNTQGYITRDDTNKQIIVAFRGSQQLQDFITDVEVVLIPFISQGVTNTNGAAAHTGFLTAYNSVASTVVSTVKSQLSAHPGYSLISTGHSLGAAIASIGGVSLAANFPGTPLRLFTFGQPRTGNPEYAAMAEDLIGAGNIFRAVHTSDGVPTIIPQSLGYRHHETEFWNFADPSIPANVKQCTGEEDPTCSNSIPSMGIDAAHLTYFGQAVGLVLDVCE